MNKRWEDFLCRNNKELDIFKRDFCVTDSELRNAWLFSRFLKESGQRGNVTVKELDEAINDKNYSLLFNLIQELFVEPLAKCYISYLQDAIEKYNIAGQDIMNWHDNKNRPHAIFINPHVIKGVKVDLT